MSRVFVVQDPHEKNIVPAEKFGSIRVMLFKKDLDRGIPHCIMVLRNELMAIKEEDSLLPIGDPIMIGLATHVALHFGEGHLNILRWVREDFCYKQELIHI